MKDCKFCGAAFPARRIDARLCLITCRISAYRARQAALVDLLPRMAGVGDSAGADGPVLASLTRVALRILGNA